MTADLCIEPPNAWFAIVALGELDTWDSGSAVVVDQAYAIVGHKQL